VMGAAVWEGGCAFTTAKRQSYGLQYLAPLWPSVHGYSAAGPHTLGAILVSFIMHYGGLQLLKPRLCFIGGQKGKLRNRCQWGPWWGRATGTG
jgi:hypothetical protein